MVVKQVKHSTYVISCNFECLTSVQSLAEEATESKGATLLTEVIFYCKSYIPKERP